MGILLSKLPEQEAVESSQTTSHGYVNQAWSTNQRRRKRDRGTDVPAKSRKKSKSSHNTGAFDRIEKSSSNDVQPTSRSLATSPTTNDEIYSATITRLDSSPMLSRDTLQDVSRREKKSRRRKKRSIENGDDVQLIPSHPKIEVKNQVEQEQSSKTPATDKKPRRKRKAPISPHFLETPISPELQEKPNKKKSKISIIETGPMPPSLPHFRPTSPDEFGLIQEKLRHDPWRMLVAVIFLNVTTAKMALPLLSQLLERWPTPEALSKANFEELSAFLYPIGLYNTRAKRLIDFSTMWLGNPPQQNVLTKRKGLTKYPPTAISHLPGMGIYALDSWRMFCAGEDEWRNVQPMDKELQAWMRWRWAQEGKTVPGSIDRDM